MSTALFFLLLGYLADPLWAATISFTQGTTTSMPGTCEDKYSDCKDYGTSDCEGPYEDWARENCAATCGYCTPKQALGFNKCNYKGKGYKTGETWQDGCDYTCTCQDGRTGQYTCTNRCLLYNNLPSECTLVVSPGECCLQPVCNFNSSISFIEGSAVGKDANGIKVCVYKGKNYYQGQYWEDGCDLKCTCSDAKQGTYSCQSYCPTYKELPIDCIFERDPNGCCERPKCTYTTFFGKFHGIGRISVCRNASDYRDVIPNCEEYGVDVCEKYKAWAKDNCAKYCAKDGMNLGPQDVCIYEGKTYKQGESWQADRTTRCLCENGFSGCYRCENPCPIYENLPAGCLTLKKLGGACDVVKCSSGTFYSSSRNLQTIGSGSGIQVSGFVPPTSATGVIGSVGTGMQPPQLTGCLYDGQIYIQDQQWEEECLKICVCKNATTGQFSCRERCPTYKNVPTSCGSVADPVDTCCTIPKCPGNNPIPLFNQTSKGNALVKPPSLAVLQSETFTVETTTTLPYLTAELTTRTGGVGYCEYKSHHYLQGQTWEDGCQYICICQNGYTGKWKCNDRCKVFENLPKRYCRLVTDPHDPCCQVPFCIFDSWGPAFYGTGHTGTFTTPHITLKATAEPVVTTSRPGVASGTHPTRAP